MSRHAWSSTLFALLIVYGVLALLAALLALAVYGYLLIFGVVSS